MNPAIGPLSVFEKDVSSSAPFTTVQHLDLDGPTAATLPNVPLFTCKVSIDASAPLGISVLGNSATAYDPGGNAIAGTSGTGASLRVTTCSADCDGSGGASLGELMLCVKAYLGGAACNATYPAQSCTVADANNNGYVSLGELVECSNRYLNGC